MPTEAQARITINKLLEAAGWRFITEVGCPASIVCEHRVTKKRLASQSELGADFQAASDGFVDYVLLNTDGRAVAVVEAKRESLDPLSAKEQARAYAEGLGVAHIFLSNGLVHYYWNLRLGNPVKVSRFLPLEELGKAAEWRPDAARLAAVQVDENYIAVSQDAAWLSYGEVERRELMVNKKIRLLRDYQLDALRALQTAAGRGHRFLFEMATGTGKTLLSAAIAKLYLRTENATRILFLVDRLELERQALDRFTLFLANDGIQTVIYKQRRRDWTEAQVIVTTIQSLAAQNRFLTEFAPTDFQLIISDEAHRTINGNNRAIFEYFIGAKLGLTATPKDYLKGVDAQERENDPRAFERRLLRDTYHTFGCPEGAPTFRYDLRAAISHQPPYLVGMRTLDARTEITTQMLSDAGYTVTVPAGEGGEETELVFARQHYERTFFSDETNLSFVRCFLDHALRDPISGEVGKTICFAVSRKHATKLVTLLNEEATRRWPQEYAAGSTFAAQVTSNVAGAQQLTIAFANNNLNGKSKWQAERFRDYDTSRTRVCVTVGMMTTGYDCEDVLNVVLARPIFSPTDFIQIKGRGTRLFNFEHVSGGKKHVARKAGFALFDFFANCEYFEKDFNYDEKLTLPKEGGGTDGGGGGSGGGAKPESFTNTSPDPLAKIIHEEVGAWGLRIDREMYRERFTHQATAAAKADDLLKTAVDAEDWAAAEERVRSLLLGKPEEYWNLPKLQELFRSDRTPSLREILQFVFGLTPAIRSRAQLADEAFERFSATQPINPVHGREVRALFTSFLLDAGCRQLLEDGRFAELRARDAGLYQSLARLPPAERANLLTYLRDNIPLSDYKQVA